MEKKTTLILMIILSFSYVNSAYSLQNEDLPLSVYPNPASQNVNIKLNTELAQQPQIQILDLTGKVVVKHQEEVSKDQDVFKASLDISNLKPGIYFVKVTQVKQTYSEKLVVK